MAIVGKFIRAEMRAAMSNCNHLTEAFLAEHWALKVQAYDKQWAEYAEWLGAEEAESMRASVVQARAEAEARRRASKIYCRRCTGLHAENPSRYQLEERAAAKAAYRRGR